MEETTRQPLKGDFQAMYSPLGSLIRRQPVTVPLDATVRQAIGIMDEKRIGSIIVADAEVLSVGRPDRGGTFGGADDTFTLTLAVDARESQLVAAGIAGGDLVITRTTGSRPAEATPPLPVDASSGASGR